MNSHPDPGQRTAYGRRTRPPAPSPDWPAAPFTTGRPRLIGIVNITEDSFSDGGCYLAPADAIAHARRLRADGADIIDLGAAASHPGSAPVDPAKEERRLAPVLDQLTADGIPVSVDSFQPQTQKFAISHGATYLNDITGFPHREMYPALAASSCHLIVMHSVQRTGTAIMVNGDPDTVWSGAVQFFDERLAALVAAGVPRDRLIIDPGLGYFLGSNPEPSLLALASLASLQTRFSVPVLVCPSRKSFLRTITSKDIAQCGPATLAAEMFAVSQGAAYIRTHDVAATRDALTVLEAISATYDTPTAEGDRRQHPSPTNNRRKR
jgi:dihydropteroate synthase type 2